MPGPRIKEMCVMLIEKVLNFKLEGIDLMEANDRDGIEIGEMKKKWEKMGSTLIMDAIQIYKQAGNGNENLNTVVFTPQNILDNSIVDQIVANRTADSIDSFMVIFDDTQVIEQQIQLHEDQNKAKNALLTGNAGAGDDAPIISDQRINGPPNSDIRIVTSGSNRDSAPSTSSKIPVSVSTVVKRVKRDANPIANEPNEWKPNVSAKQKPKRGRGRPRKANRINLSNGIISCPIVSNNERPYKCNVNDCDYSGRLKHHLKIHMKKHRCMFPCLTCGKRFMHLHSLVEHKKEHE